MLFRKTKFHSKKLYRIGIFNYSILCYLKIPNLLYIFHNIIYIFHNIFISILFTENFNSNNFQLSKNPTPRYSPL